jgi:sulfur-carrier protein
MTVAANRPADGTARVRVAMPYQLRHLARVSGEVEVEVDGPVTLGAVLDALETAYPTLQGPIRDRRTRQRRAMIRIYADGEDLSNADAQTLLPGGLREGREPLRIVGAIAGG